VTALDCQDETTALATLAAVQVRSHSLERALRESDEAAFQAHPMDDPFGLVLASLGVEIGTVRLSEVRYFHGTRTEDPDVFAREGIRPLGDLVDRIWTSLGALAGCPADEWAAFREPIEAGGGGHDGELYRLKVRDEVHHGPHGELVREPYLSPGSRHFGDFLGAPRSSRTSAAATGAGCSAPSARLGGVRREVPRARSGRSRAPAGTCASDTKTAGARATAGPQGSPVRAPASLRAMSWPWRSLKYARRGSRASGWPSGDGVRVRWDGTRTCPVFGSPVR
jgi:hypothetical protein